MNKLIIDWNVDSETQKNFKAQLLAYFILLALHKTRTIYQCEGDDQVSWPFSYSFYNTILD